MKNGMRVKTHNISAGFHRICLEFIQLSFDLSHGYRFYINHSSRYLFFNPTSRLHFEGIPYEHLLAEYNFLSFYPEDLRLDAQQVYEAFGVEK